MNINILQSLIDRTSNQIAEYEACIRWEYDHRHLSCNDFEIEQSKYTVSYYKSRLPKLREIQKALKKEIAGMIRLERGVRYINKMREVIGAE